MVTVRRTLQTILAILTIAGCGTPPAAIPDARRAAADVHLSFVGVSADGAEVTLSRAALGKAFLLRATVTEATHEPALDYLRPKVVAFESQGKFVALMELNTMAVYDALPSRRILQTLPIVSESAQNITFNWGLGLTDISTKATTASVDFEGSIEAMVDPIEPTLSVATSFVRLAEFRDNHLYLEQVARVRTPGWEEDGDRTLQLGVTLAPYQPNPQFMARASTQLHEVGYFEVAQPRKGNGAIDIFATRWDLSEQAGPVTYAIVRDTPPEWIEAVRDGVLYWNSVFGREVVRVEAGADAREKPAARRVLIHWLPMLQHTYARAALEPDPMTGEILGANIFVTSIFAHASESYVSTADATPRASVAPVGFRRAPGCNYDGADQWVALTALRSRSEGALERTQAAVADYVRSIVAHEVGHTLGLRHNFAASLASEFATPKQTAHAWDDYMHDAHHAGGITAASVMDYLIARDEFLLGAAIRHHALPYDQAAIRWGYDAAPTAPSAGGGLFCTDAQMWNGLTLGCDAIDSGQQPLAGYIETLEMTRQALPHALVDDLIYDMQANGGVRSVRQLLSSINPYRYAAVLVQPANYAFTSLTESARVLALDPQVDGNDWADEDATLHKTRVAQHEALAAVGGLTGFLAPVQPGWLTQGVQQVLRETPWARGLSAAQVSDVKVHLPAFAAVLEEAYLEALLLALGGAFSSVDAPWWSPELVAAPWQDTLGPRLEGIVLAHAGTKDGTVDDVTLHLPRARYAKATRMAAAALYNREIFQRHDWLQASGVGLAQQLRERLLVVANYDIDGSHSDDIERWVADETAVLQALTQALGNW